MRRLIFPGVALVVAVALLALLGFGVASQGANTSIDAKVSHGSRPAAPDLTMKLPRLGAAGTQTLASFHGRVVVLNVFASWCQPCQSEAPVLEREQHVLAAHGGTVLGVTYLDNSSDSQRFVRQWHLSYPVIRDVDGNFVRAFGTTGVPETFVIDRQGRIAALRRYQVDASWLNQTVQAILGERS